MVMPEMALEPDISGVCSWEGTLAISSKPRKMASTKTKNSRIHVDSVPYAFSVR